MRSELVERAREGDRDAFAVLAADSIGRLFNVAHAKAELYDPASGTFSPTGSMAKGRQQHTATLLADGRVLLTGGYWSDGSRWDVLSSAELYDPGTGKFTAAGSMGQRRVEHTATLLDDGRVLIAGGADYTSKNGTAVSSALLYQP